MSKRSLLLWSLLALVSGVGWIAMVHPPLGVALGMVMLSLCLCGLSWWRGV